MGFKLTYAAEVYDDLQENIDWFNQKQTGLGSRFLKAVKEQITRIKKNPHTIAVRYEDVRCAKVKGFPYLVHFKIFQDTSIIKVTAVFSTHRDPIIRDERTNK
jgi:mRNA-degrading endonuclease RelE of RelBE toxin-antitoxin system